MKLLEHNYICPFCFNRNNMSEVDFRCTNEPTRCAPEKDELLSQFTGTTQIMGKTFQVEQNGGFKLGGGKMPKEAHCPQCQQKTTRRLCPKCHSELPYTVGEFKDLVIAIIGAKEAGKSHYIAVLLNKLNNDVGTGFDCNLHPLNDNTMTRYREDFWNPLQRGEIIRATVSGHVNFNVRTPLIYTLSFLEESFLKKKKIKDVVTLVFFDTAGEDLNDEDTMTTVNKYICNAAGIIFLLDPLQLPEVRSNLPADTPLPEQNTEIEDILARTANLIRKSKGLKANDLIDIPVAVAFSKTDAIEPLLDPSNCLAYPSKHTETGSFDLADYESVNGEMESLVREWSGNHFANQLRLNFNTYAYFGLSSLGCNPHGSTKIPKIRPRRVEDPFLWLLWKHGVIKGNKRK